MFRNCRLIGRRFRLAHVFFGREIIEVATFRAMSAPEPGEECPSRPRPISTMTSTTSCSTTLDDEDESTRAWCSPRPVRTRPDSTAARRCRARSFAPCGRRRRRRRGSRHRRTRPHPARQRLRHHRRRRVAPRFHRQRALLQHRRLLDLGLRRRRRGHRRAAPASSSAIPSTRYREDPVRMLRAARFEAKLGFSLDGDTGSPDRAAARAAGQRAAGATVRRDAEAVPHRSRRAQPGGAAARAACWRELLPTRGALPRSASGRRGGAAAAAGPDEHRCSAWRRASR